MANLLSQQLQQAVFDKMGLAGKYDLELNWTQDQGFRSDVQGNGQTTQSKEHPAPDTRLYRTFDLYCTSGTEWTEAPIGERSG